MRICALLFSDTHPGFFLFSHFFFFASLWLRALAFLQPIFDAAEVVAGLHTTLQQQNFCPPFLPTASLSPRMQPRSINVSFRCWVFFFFSISSSLSLCCWRAESTFCFFVLVYVLPFTCWYWLCHRKCFFFSFHFAVAVGIQYNDTERFLHKTPQLSVWAGTGCNQSFAAKRGTLRSKVDEITCRVALIVYGKSNACGQCQPPSTLLLRALS